MSSAILATQKTAPVDSAFNDAYSRVRTSNPHGLFALQCQYDLETFLMEGGATGTGVAPAHSTDTRLVALSATAGTGVSFFQSYEYLPYQPGKSQLVMCTGIIGAAVANAVVDYGIGDANNGLFFRQNGTTGLAFVRRTKTSGSVVDNAVVQSSWSVDKFDGTGPSGLTLDITKIQVWVFDAQYLSAGRARCGFSIHGTIYWAHEFRNANVIDVPYMQTLSLPISMTVTATASGSTKTSYFKCATVISEGGIDDIGYQWASPEQLVTAGNETQTALISLRPFLTYNSITNRAAVRIHSIELQVTGASPVRWELCIGSTFSVAPTWAGAAIHAGTGVEASTAPGTLSAAGFAVEGGYASGSAQNKGTSAQEVHKRVPLTLTRAGANHANGTATLVVLGCGGASACRALINYYEVR